MSARIHYGERMYDVNDVELAAIREEVAALIAAPSGLGIVTIRSGENTHGLLVGGGVPFIITEYGDYDPLTSIG